MSDTPHFTNVTLRDIAKRSGYSVATVSRALRDGRRVSQETADEIKRLADEMGYRPNPMINSLMVAHKRRRPRQELTSNICWLNTHPDKDIWHRMPYNQHFVDAAKERAHELGYGFEEIWASEPGLTSERLHQILHSRYVQGLIVPGPVVILMDGGFDWGQYGVVCLRDKNPGQLDWHRCSISARKNIEKAYERLYQLGYRRIAYAGGIFVIDQEAEQQMSDFNDGKSTTSAFLLQEGMRVQLAGFTYCQAFAQDADRIWPFFFDNRENADLSPVAEWLNRVRPEAVISNGSTIYEAVQLAGLTVPGDLALAHTSVDDDVSGWAGMYTHPRRQARAAVDMLCAQIERNERGLPEFPKRMYVEGDWRDGWTAPGKE